MHTFFFLDNSSNRTLIAIVMSVVGMFLFINIFIAAMFAACMRTQTMSKYVCTYVLCNIHMDTVPLDLNFTYAHAQKATARNIHDNAPE